MDVWLFCFTNVEERTDGAMSGASCHSIHQSWKDTMKRAIIISLFLFSVVATAQTINVTPTSLSFPLTSAGSVSDPIWYQLQMSGLTSGVTYSVEIIAPPFFKVSMDMFGTYTQSLTYTFTPNPGPYWERSVHVRFCPTIETENTSRGSVTNRFMHQSSVKSVAITSAPVPTPQPWITVTPAMLSFPPTPVGSFSEAQYTITGRFNGLNQITITAPQYFQVSSTYWSGTGWVSSLTTWAPPVSTWGTFSTIIGVRFSPTNETDTSRTGRGVISNTLVGYNTADATLSSAPLPVQLASFTGRVLSGRQGVALEWSTLSEINNYGFEIERAFHLTNFQTIPNVFIPGNGTTNEPRHYRYTDSNATPGQRRYRLKQFDLDGTVHLSEPIHVDVVTTVGDQTLAEFALCQNFPNPFNPSTTIRYALSERSHVRLEVYNLLGECVSVLANEERSAGTYSVQFDATGLASGIYYYRLQSDGQIATKKLVLMR